MIYIFLKLDYLYTSFYFERLKKLYLNIVIWRCCKFIFAFQTRIIFNRIIWRAYYSRSSVKSFAASTFPVDLQMNIWRNKKSTLSSIIKIFGYPCCLCIQLLLTLNPSPLTFSFVLNVIRIFSVCEIIVDGSDLPHNLEPICRYSFPPIWFSVTFPSFSSI